MSQKQARSTPKSRIRNHATTGKPTTPSGSGVVLGEGRNGGSKKGTKVNMANPAKSKDWWEGAANQSHEQPHDMMRLSAGLHQLADSLYRPGAGAERPIGSSGLADRRLYESKGNGRTNSKARTATKVTQKTANKTTRKTTASRMPNGKRRGN
jgi:hypothetical protein